MYHIIGLGNVGKRYEMTRHNTGFMIVEILRVLWDLEEWTLDSMTQTCFSCGEVGGEPIRLFMPDTFMNTSGEAVRKLKKAGLEADKCIVIHDEIDFPLGVVKFVYDRGSGGHRGVDSVIKAFGTKKFFRFRVGISTIFESGMVKKTRGENEVQNFILGRFSKKEKEEIEKAGLRIGRYTEKFLSEGYEKTISSFKG